MKVTKVYIVMKEDVRRGEIYPLKCFRNEKKAIEFLKLSVDKIVKNTKLSIFDISDKNKKIYYDDEDAYYYYEYSFYVISNELE